MTVDDRVELVGKRIEFLDALADAPRHKPALVEALDRSRSTVDRALRDLETAGLVDRTGEGFRTTLTGRLAADNYRAFLDDAGTILDGVAFLGALPPDCDLPREVVKSGAIETFESAARAFETTVEPIRTADRYVAFLPQLGDSRRLRLCHARVQAGMRAELLVDPAVLTRMETEFPRLTADLAVADGVDIYRVDADRPYALFLADGPEPTVSVLPTAETTGVLTATTGAAVAWAEATLDDLRASGTDVTDEVAALREDLDGTLLGRQERRGAVDLADIGVERFDPAALSRLEPNDPATGWRVGFDLVDAYYGHPFERHHQPDDGAENGDDADVGTERAVDAVTRRLRDGENTVVVGPPGTGKSTCCRQVAARWVAAGHGPVFYRKTPAGTAFDRLDPLTAALDEAEGHALVVVEDGDDEVTTEGLTALLERGRDDPTLSVLVEARTEGWPPTPGDPRQEDVLRSTVTTYRLGELSLAECRDAVAAFEAATGRSVPTTADDLYATVRDGDGPGDCSLLGYLLAAYTTSRPWSDAAAQPTGLDADARAGYEVVAPDGPDDDTLPLAVGVLVALLAAAKQPVTPAALHTLAVAAADDEEARASAHRRVDAAIDDLCGVALFDRADGPAFRTQHPYWAVRFLDAALDADERGTVNVAGRALSALFAPADDPGIRDAIERWFGHRLEEFDRLESGIDDTVVGVFRVVRSYTGLVRLFGTTEFSAIDLPDACTPETRLAVRAERLFGWYKRGDLDNAEAEARGLLDAAEGADVDAETAARFVVQARRRLADVADDRGDPATAREHLDAGLETARSVDDRRGETRLLASRGMVELHADDYDAAESYLREAESVGEPLGPSPELSAAVYYLGRLHRKRGAFEAAERRFREALEIDRQCDLPPSDEAATLNALGTVAVDQGAHDRAERYYRQALERQRAANNTRGVAAALVNLGDLLVETDDVAAAEACFEEARDLAADAAVAVVHGAALSGLGRVATARGDLEAAEAYHHERLAVDDSARTRATATRYLGDVAVAAGDHSTARERYETAFETYLEVGANERAAATALDLVETCVEAGATGDARAWLSRVDDLVTDADLGAFQDAAAAWHERLASD